jgi:hypothetical protein
MRLCRRFSLLNGQTPELLLLLLLLDRFGRRLLLLLLLLAVLLRCFCIGAAELHLSAATGLPSKHAALSELLLLLSSDGLCPAGWTSTTNDMRKQQQQIMWRLSCVHLNGHSASQHDNSKCKLCTVPFTAYNPYTRSQGYSACSAYPAHLFASRHSAKQQLLRQEQHQQTTQQWCPPAALQNSAPPGTICCNWLHTRLLLSWLVQGVMCPVDSSKAK